MVIQAQYTLFYNDATPFQPTSTLLRALLSSMSVVWLQLGKSMGKAMLCHQQQGGEDAKSFSCYLSKPAVISQLVLDDIVAKFRAPHSVL